MPKQTKFPDENVPAINVTCQGTPREMGEAQGEVLKERIQALRDRLAELEAFRLKQPRWMPYRLYRSAAEQTAEKYLAQALAGSSEWAERLQGLAAGAGLKSKAVSLFHALEPLLATAGAEASHAVAAACSAVCVRGSRSATGQPLLARNFDYLPLAQPYYILRREEPQRGLRSLIFTTVPLVGAVDGMNESGLCMTYNYAVANDFHRPAPTISLRIAEALTHCRSVEEAVAWITNLPRWGSGLLMLADETGDIAALELSHTQSQLRRPAAGVDVLFHSNRYQSSAMFPVQVPSTAVWSRQAPKALRGKRILQSAETRDCRLQELLTKQRRFDCEDLSRLMADHGPEDHPSDDSICKHSDYWHTTASLQLLPSERRIRVSYTTTCQAEYREFQV